MSELALLHLGCNVRDAMPGKPNGEGLAMHKRERWTVQRVLRMVGYAERLARISPLGFGVLPKPRTP